MKLTEIDQASNQYLTESLINEYSLDSLNESSEVIRENLSSMMDRVKDYLQRRRVSKVKASIMMMDDSKVFYLTSDDQNMVKEMIFEGNNLLEENDLTMNEVEARVEELKEQGYRSVRRETTFRNMFRIIFKVLFGYFRVIDASALTILAIVAFTIGITSAIPTMILISSFYLSGAIVNAGIAWFTFNHTGPYEKEPDAVEGQF